MKCSLNKSSNNKKTQLSGKYVTLIESKTPWYKSKSYKRI